MFDCSVYAYFFPSVVAAVGVAYTALLYEKGHTFKRQQRKLHLP